MPFYILDADNNTLWAGKEQGDGPIKFKTFKAADKRAKGVAECNPGFDIQIVETIAIVRCEVAKPKTKRT